MAVQNNYKPTDELLHSPYKCICNNDILFKINCSLLRFRTWILRIGEAAKIISHNIRLRPAMKYKLTIIKKADVKCLNSSMSLVA